MTAEPLTLYGFWRSNATFRVRVALNIKGVPYREVPVDLDAGAQFDPAFLAQNPEGAVPALVDGDAAALTQSLAMLEYLDERYPEPPLLPADAAGRARVRSLAAGVACDVHPLIVPRVRKYLTEEARLGADDFRGWIAHWVARGLETLETRLSSSPATGRFCHGDVVTVADICVAGLALIPQLLTLDVPRTPVLTGIVERCFSEPAFAAAHPMNQQGAPTES